MTVRLSHLLAALAIVAAIVAGVCFGQAKGRLEAVAAIRAKVAAAKARGEAVEIPAPKKAKKRDPNRPELLTLYRGGAVVRRELRDPHTGTLTALPLDAPDPRPPEQDIQSSDQERADGS